MIWEERDNFDYSSYPPNDCKKYYCKHRAVDESFPRYSDGLLAILVGHMIRALEKGYCRICDVHCGEITITDLYFYVHDLFQFEDDQTLSYWNKTYLNFIDDLIQEQ